MKLRRKIIEIGWKSQRNYQLICTNCVEKSPKSDEKSSEKFSWTNKTDLKTSHFWCRLKLWIEEKKTLFWIQFQRPQRCYERGKILVLINWLSAFYIFATLGDWLCKPANQLLHETNNASQPKLTNFISGSKFAWKKLKNQTLI